MDLDNNRIRLPQASTMMGPDPNCDVCIDNTSISRRQAEIRNTARGFLQIDNKSTNGTFVAEKPIDRCVLENGVRHRFGNHLYKFLFNDCIPTQHHETVYSMMPQDGLTGALNKRFMMDLIQREFDRANRYQRPLTILMRDINFFKKVNDTYAH